MWAAGASFSVPVDQTRLMDCLEAGEKLRRQIARLGELQRRTPPEDVEQRHAVDVLHRHQLLAVDLDQIEHPADVGRDHLAGGAHLAPQRLESPRILDQIGAQRLQRQIHPQLQIPGAPDLAHAAAA